MDKCPLFDITRIPAVFHYSRHSFWHKLGTITGDDMKRIYYRLDGHAALPCKSVEEWARSFEWDDRQVARTTIGNAEVSTIFLGIDHGHFGNRPLLFETMIFGGAHDGYQDRYSTWTEAEEGHAEVCEMLKAECYADEADPHGR